MKVMFLNPPSFSDFDGGAGARYQATREVRSLWYPVWLTYPAGMLPDSKVVDAVAAGFDAEKTLDFRNRPMGSNARGFIEINYQVRHSFVEQ